jgi:hypothetical protein
MLKRSFLCGQPGDVKFLYNHDRWDCNTRDYVTYVAWEYKEMNKTLLWSGLAVVSMVTLAGASIPEGDVRPYIDGGVLKTGLVSEDGLDFTPDVRVFFAELGEDVPNFTAEPGWQAEDGTFAPGGIFSFEITRAVRTWNGTDFSTVAGQIRLGYGTLTPVTSPFSDAVVPGFDLPIDEEGGLHDHPDYELLAPSADGIYLLELTFSVPSQGLGSTAPLWILFGQNADGVSAQAAFDYATATIPAPGVMFMLGGAGLVAVRRRRK